MKSSFFEKNRQKLFEKLDNNSAAVLFAGKAPCKRGDEFYPFSPDRNFYYVTGIDKERAIVLFIKNNGKNQTILYIQRNNDELSKWIGKNQTSEEAEKISGISNIKFIDEFEENFSDFIFKLNIKNLYSDLENRNIKNVLSPSIEFINNCKQNFPSINIMDLYIIFAGLRRKKEEEEINLIRKAIDITIKGIYEMMLDIKPNMYEYEIEAYFDFILKKNGVKDKAFQSIIASGKNGTILHYADNNSEIKDGDLILADVGAQFQYYNGDITRTFPADGKFTPQQKQIYNIVLEGQQKVIDNVVAGIPFLSLNEILKDFYYTELAKIGLVKNKEDVAKYYYHNVSHFLGAETHDICLNDKGTLEKGMIITVEPGLYIQELGIGIRIEDDVLVTENGCEVLSKDMIKTVEEIEEFMTQRINKENDL